MAVAGRPTIDAMTFVHEADMLKGSPLAGWSGRFFHSEHMTFARWTIEADAADLHEHQHPYEEVWNIVGGQGPESSKRSLPADAGRASSWSRRQ